MTSATPSNLPLAGGYSPTFIWRVSLPLAIAYLISYGLRTVNAAIAPTLTREFGLDAADLGLLTAAYFLSFSLAQLPLGGLLDRFRPRRVEAGLLLSCAAGCAVFAGADASGGLILGRALIGLGVAACLMAALRTFGQWLHADRLPTTNGLMLAVGNAGAILSTAPVLWLLGLITWRQLFLCVAVLSAVVALWLAFMTPDPPRAPGDANGTRQPVRPGGWGDVARSRLFWAIVPLPCLTNAIGLAVQGLWAGPWLIDVGGIAPSDIGGLLLLISAGMLVANISLGSAMGRLMRRGVSPVVFCFVCCLFALVGQLAFMFSWRSAPAVTMTLFGLTHVAGNLLFAALFSRFDSRVHGRLSTLINFLMFSLGFALQWGVGLVVNRFPDSPGHYQAAGYERAFLLLLLLQVVCIAWTAFRWRTVATSPAPGKVDA
ncbi:MAG: MFS transporter [Burkholderiales bacterium]|nr:MFS transporter [Burkholderiales bacterium]